jgi:hypothetical protein
VIIPGTRKLIADIGLLAGKFRLHFAKMCMVAGQFVVVDQAVSGRWKTAI